MIVEITPSELNGKVAPPYSKSYAHRALICAALGSSPCRLVGIPDCDDIRATEKCLVSLGAKIKRLSGARIVEPISSPRKTATLSVGASGSTLRFMLPVCASLGTETKFNCSERLAKRPISDLMDVLKEHGIKTGRKDNLKIRGHISGGEYVINGGVSSQYITGLMLALPRIGGGKIITKGNIVSKDYLKITISVLSAFGITVKEKDGVFEVTGEYVSPTEFRGERDWSSAGFFAVAGANGNICLTGIDILSAQGDKAILEALNLAGAKSETVKEIRIKKGEPKAFGFNVENCPDCAPILSVLAAMCPGKSTLSGTSRLKMKESDRSLEIVKMLTAFGIKAIDYGDRIEIYGGKLKGCELDLPEDHRIAMSASIAAANAEGKTILRGAECINKSYPKFYDDFVKVGGRANVLGV